MFSWVCTSSCIHHPQLPDWRVTSRMKNSFIARQFCRFQHLLCGNEPLSSLRQCQVGELGPALATRFENLDGLPEQWQGFSRVFGTSTPGFLHGRMVIFRLLQLLFRFEQYFRHQFRLFILPLFTDGNDPPPDRSGFLWPATFQQVIRER